MHIRVTNVLERHNDQAVRKILDHNAKLRQEKQGRLANNVADAGAEFFHRVQNSTKTVKLEEVRKYYFPNH